MCIGLGVGPGSGSGHGNGVGIGVGSGHGNGVGIGVGSGSGVGIGGQPCLLRELGRAWPALCPLMRTSRASGRGAAASVSPTIRARM